MTLKIVVILISIGILIPFLIMFERKKPKAAVIVVLAVLIALAVASRAIFFMLPWVKPLLAFVVIAGISFGKCEGFIVGAMTAFVSNFLFGQGPWTIFQMVAWGLVGVLAAALSNWLLNGSGEPKKALVVAYTFLATIVIHGLIVDLWTIISMSEAPTFALILGVYGAAIVPNLIFATTGSVFVFFLAGPMVKKINRVKKKLGI